MFRLRVPDPLTHTRIILSALYQRGSATKKGSSLLPLRRWFQDAGLVVGGLVDPAAHRVGFHLIGGVGPQEVHEGFLILEAPIQPRS